MKKLIVLFMGCCLLFLSSCINMVEEMYLNRDGSGKYTLTFDMSGLFSDPFMKGMMEESLKGEEKPGLFGFKEGEDMELDTVIYFKDMPAEEKQKLDRPDFWNKVVMRMTMSESQKKFVTTLELDFDDVGDIDYFYKNLDKLGNNSQLGGELMGPGGFLGGGALFELKKKRLTRLSTEKPENLMKGDEMEFVKMFFGSSSYKTIYHLPGKVKKVTLKGAEVNGKTVTVNTPFLELIEGKANQEGEIKFK